MWINRRENVRNWTEKNGLNLSPYKTKELKTKTIFTFQTVIADFLDCVNKSINI